jgi:hypothetical protein
MRRYGCIARSCRASLIGAGRLSHPEEGWRVDAGDVHTLAAYP